MKKRWQREFDDPIPLPNGRTLKACGCHSRKAALRRGAKASTFDPTAA
jgi:hypothetical protein